MNLHITDHRISAAVKLGAEKKSGLNEIRLNPWPPPYQCSVLPTELSSQLGDHRKVYITVKLIKCGIRRKNYFKNLISCGLEQTSFQTHNWQCLLIWVTCCVFTSTTKQAGHCQSADDRLIMFLVYLTEKKTLKLQLARKLINPFIA